MSEPGTVALPVDHEGSVQAIAFSPDSTRFASAGSDTVLRVRPVEIGTTLDVTVDGSVTGIAFSPDGGKLAVADFEQVFLRDSASGTALWQGRLAPGNSVNTVRFVPDGQLVAATDTLVAVLEQATGKITRRITVDPPLIADLDLSRDGTRLALAIDERHGGNHRRAGSARVLELATGTETTRLTPDNAVFAVAFDRDGKRVLCCAADDTTRLFDAQDGKQVWSTADDVDVDGRATAPSCLDFDPKGQWVVVGGSDGFARVFDADTGVERCRAPKLAPGGPDPGAVTHVAFSPNGKLAASASIDNVVRLFNLDGRELYAVPTDEVLTMTFSPNGRWLGVGCFDRALVIDNGESNQG
ncbi:WD40 repeat domain-containing protein [Streptomyces resistomycificus]|uniref:Peptidase C14 n=1 Tax=Streptomyces resistomycificus TaxID=67356 RepID=A0A0L8LUI5_9ACTN|nr:WD40 repeat domain-containing protein [Streptomyces resistomycificus]KOG41710.1 peptidase C14 [Streptomyces resistomycificus]KUN95864.1 peptidase C14 [Streptomyces resistomycificus]